MSFARIRRAIARHRQPHAVTAVRRHARAWKRVGFVKIAAPLGLLTGVLLATGLFVGSTNSPPGLTTPPRDRSQAVLGDGAPLSTLGASAAPSPAVSPSGSPPPAASPGATAPNTSTSTPSSAGPHPKLIATPKPAPTPPPPHAPHVMVVMLENRGYAATLGSCAADTYLCSLAAGYMSDTAWSGVAHPSLPNYLAATTGSTQGCTSDTCFGPYNAPSLGGQLTAAGIPWTAYMESMPTPCYRGQFWGGAFATALYVEKHDPFVLVNDVLDNGCAQHVLPYPGGGGLVAALDGPSPPDFVWITPNQQNDMHTGSVQAGDAWLRANLAPVLSSPWFTGGNATVVVTMDEDEGNNAGGGGPLPMVVVSSNARGAGLVGTPGNQYGTLRSIERAYGLGLLAGAANSANGDLSGRFGGPG